MQEYFLVACSLRRHRPQISADQYGLAAPAREAAIQMNDTHPSLAVPELMRILLDQAHLGWDEAFDLTGGRSPIPTTRSCPRRSSAGLPT